MRSSSGLEVRLRPGPLSTGVRPVDLGRIRSITDLLAPRTRLVDPGREDAACPARGPVHTYLPFPSLRSTRLLVPLDTPDTAAAAVTLRSTPRHGGARRAAYRLLAQGLSSGLVQRVLRSRVDVIGADPVTGDGASLADHLGGLLGVPVAVSAKVAPGDPHRTVGMHVVAADGSLLAFVKVAGGELSRRLLVNEARALTRLAEHDDDGVLAWPRLLHHGSWEGLHLLVTTPLELLGSRPLTLDEPPPVQAVRAVAATGRCTSGPVFGSDYWRWTRARIGGFAAAALDTGQRRTLARLVDIVEGTCGPVVLPYGAWHGDFLPWNLAWDSGRLVTWDWEYWAASVPLGFDLLHYCAGTLFFREGADVRDALEEARQWAGDGLAELGLDDQQAGAVCALYGLEFLLRRLDIAAHGGGEDDRRVFPEVFSVVAEAALAAAQRVPRS